MLAAGLVGIPAILAVAVGWPLPHHLPGAAQVADALRTLIPDSFWPHLFASLAWLAWAYFAFSVVATVVANLGAGGGNRLHRLGRHRAAAALISAVITAVVVLGQLRAACRLDRQCWRTRRRRALRHYDDRAARGRHRASGQRTTHSGDTHGGGR